MVTMKRSLFTLLSVVFFMTFLGASGLRQYYTRRMPEAAWKTEGRVVPVRVNYNKTVYVTAGEKRGLEFAYLAVGVMAAAFVLSGWLYAKCNRRITNS